MRMGAARCGAHDSPPGVSAGQQRYFSTKELPLAGWPFI